MIKKLCNPLEHKVFDKKMHVTELLIVPINMLIPPDLTSLLPSLFVKQVAILHFLNHWQRVHLRSKDKAIGGGFIYNT